MYRQAVPEQVMFLCVHLVSNNHYDAQGPSSNILVQMSSVGKVLSQSDIEMIIFSAS